MAKKITLPAPASRVEPFKTDAKEVADRFKNVEVRLVVADNVAENVTGDEAVLAMAANLLGRAGWTEGSEVTASLANAVIDTFVKAERLERQKAWKADTLTTIDEPVLDEAGEPVLNEDGTPQVNKRGITAEELQANADAHVVKEVTRGKGESKAEATKAKAARAEKLDDAARSAREKLLAMRDSDPAQYNIRLEMFRELNPEAAEGLEPVEA